MSGQSFEDAWLHLVDPFTVPMGQTKAELKVTFAAGWQAAISRVLDGMDRGLSPIDAMREATAECNGYIGAEKAARGA